MSEYRCTSIATGGDGVSRMPDGRVVFIRGALPGELVRVEITRQSKDFARAAAVGIIEPSPGRVAPGCVHATEGCGGCGWQHVAPELQHDLKRSIVVDSLVRVAKLPGAGSLVHLSPPLAAGGHRTSIRAMVVDGHVGFRSYRSNEMVPAASCVVADPVLEHLLVNSDFAAASEVTLRRGVGTGEVMVIVAPDAGNVRLADHPAVSRRTVVGAEVLRQTAQPTFRESVCGHIFTISAGSFFQTRTDGAERLVRLVREGLDSFDGRRALLADLYGGVGLFAVTAADGFDEVVSVEREGCSAADARANLAGNPSASAVASDVDHFDLRGYAKGRSTVVVADPARGGLGKAGVKTIVDADPRGIVLVSCDAASLGRDAGLLAAAGYQLRSSVVVDMFPHTPHVEVVSCFDPPI